MFGVHITFAETAAVSRGTSHVTIKTALRPLWWIFRMQATVSHLESHTTIAQWVFSDTENSATVATAKRVGLREREVRC